MKRERATYLIATASPKLNTADIDSLLAALLNISRKKEAKFPNLGNLVHAQQTFRITS